MNTLVLKISQTVLKTVLLPFILQLLDDLTTYLNKTTKNFLEK